METLSHTDILALNHAIGEIYSARDLESFYSSVFSSIQNMISNENCSYNDIEIKTIHFLKITHSSHDHNDVAENLLPTLNAYAHEHPLAAHCFSGNAIKTSDFVSTGEFKRLSIYNEFYRHLDTEIQMTVSIPVSREKVALFALSRNITDFSERDRFVLNMLRPHLLNALRNVTELDRMRFERDLLKKGADVQKQGVVLCQPAGMVIALSELAAEMFARYCAVTLSEGDILPVALAQWLAMEIGRVPGEPGKSARQVERDVFIVEKDGKRLIIKLMNDITSGECILLLTENDPAALLRSLQRYGMSPRETEVVHWLAKGKTNVEISIILNISKRTADKHLEHIFAKLGVETRTAAISIIRNECNVN